MVIFILFAGITALLLVMIAISLIRFFKSRKKRINPQMIIESIGELCCGIIDKIKVGDLEYVKKQRDRAKIYRKALFLNEESEKRKKRKQIGGCFLCLLFGCLLSTIAAYSEMNREAVHEITRPLFGETESLQLVFDDGKEQTDVQVEISGKIPSAEEIQQVFSEEAEAMKEIWLNGNASFEEIRTNMDFQEETERGIKVFYQSMSPDIISNRGILLLESIPEDGIVVRIEVTFRYLEYEANTLINCRVLPKLPEVVSKKEMAENAIKEADGESLQNTVFKLPDVIDGNSVVFFQKGKSPTAFLFISFLMIVAILWVPRDRIKRNYEERNLEIIDAYPEVVSKLELLMRVGMSTRGAWYRIVSDYEAQREKDHKQIYVYEEMKTAVYQMSSGTSETEAYLEFGRRCGTQEYIRFSNMLVQNLRQGISGLDKGMRAEREEALLKHRMEALRKGEKASTKLLLPMLIMFGIVMALLVIPVFMSL